MRKTRKEHSIPTANESFFAKEHCVVAIMAMKAMKAMKAVKAIRAMKMK